MWDQLFVAQHGAMLTDERYQKLVAGVMNVTSVGKNFHDSRLLKSDDRFIVRDKSERALSLKDDTVSASCSYDFLPFCLCYMYRPEEISRQSNSSLCRQAMLHIHTHTHTHTYLCAKLFRVKNFDSPLTKPFFPVAQQLNSGIGCFIVEVSR